MRQTTTTLQVLVAALAVFFLVSAPAPVAAQDIVSFNTATVDELMAIEDIDIPEELARAIVAYREANGPFKRPEELQKVPGMTQDFFEELNPVLRDGDVVYDPDAEPALAPSKC
jgi:competence protein ComEA